MHLMYLSYPIYHIYLFNAIDFVISANWELTGLISWLYITCKWVSVLVYQLYINNCTESKLWMCKMHSLIY